MISTTKLFAATQRAGRSTCRWAGLGVVGAVVLAVLVLAPSTAQAQDDYQGGYYGANDQYGAAPADGQEPPIPPYVEGQPIASEGGGYCYVGPHPVDTRAVPGPAFEDVQGQHIRPYAPVDLRLFSFRDGCYYFIGDPRDFGYSGQSYSYYGAHPVLDTYGGGWCFMMGGHYHLWQPWSPYFTVVGPWYYWYGPYDPFFWSYWPYYSFYYRSYYPNYYAGGRFYRGGSYRAAPPIQRVPATGWRGTPPAAGVAGGGFRGAPPNSPASAGAWRSGAPAGAAAAAPWRGAPQSGSSGVAPFRAPSVPSAAPGWRGTPSPSFSAPRPGGGFSGGGAFRGGHRR
ncbi:MAG TPA: hypothetical protein VFH68_04885 [Polyangia bacterium]|jgi:hypothetical protein|nr:hypothetical protein [Polyangia bacterium]